MKRGCVTLLLCSVLLGAAYAQDGCGEPLTLQYCKDKKADTLYPNPMDCQNSPCAKTYVVCQGSIPRVMPCSAGTVFANGECVKTPASCALKSAASTAAGGTAPAAPAKANPVPAAPAKVAAPSAKQAVPTAEEESKAPAATAPAKEATAPVEKETPAPAAEEETPAPAAEEETPAPAAEEETPAPAAEEETTAPAEEEETTAPAEEEETPAPAEEEETPAPAEEEETPAEEEETPAAEEEEETLATAEEDETSATGDYKDSSSEEESVSTDEAPAARSDDIDLLTEAKKKAAAGALTDEEVSNFVDALFAPAPEDAFDAAMDELASRSDSDEAESPAEAPGPSSGEESYEESEENPDCPSTEFSFDIAGEVDDLTLDDVVAAVGNATNVKGIKGVEMPFVVRVGIIMKDFPMDVTSDLESPVQMAAKKLVVYSQKDAVDEADVSVIAVTDKIQAEEDYGESSVSIRSTSPCEDAEPVVSNTVMVDMEVEPLESDAKAAMVLEDSLLDMPTMKGLKKMLKRVVDPHESGFKSPKEMQDYIKDQLRDGNLAVVTALVAKPIISIPDNCKNQASKVKNALSDSFESGDFADQLSAVVGSALSAVPLQGEYSIGDVPGVDLPSMAPSPAGAPTAAPAPCPAKSKGNTTDEEEAAMDAAEAVLNGTTPLEVAMPPLPAGQSFNESLADGEENAAAAGGVAAAATAAMVGVASLLLLAL